MKEAEKAMNKASRDDPTAELRPSSSDNPKESWPLAGSTSRQIAQLKDPDPCRHAIFLFLDRLSNFGVSRTTAPHLRCSRTLIQATEHERLTFYRSRSHFTAAMPPKKEEGFKDGEC